jgi:uncharacterized membrane protein
MGIKTDKIKVFLRRFSSIKFSSNMNGERKLREARPVTVTMQLSPLDSPALWLAKTVLTKTVYVLSATKAILVAGFTTLLVRPGILFRAVLSVERLTASILGYRSLTPISDEAIAGSLARFTLGTLIKISQSPIGIGILVGVCTLTGVHIFKTWVEKLVIYLAEKGDFQRTDGAPERAFLPEPESSLMEENRRLRLELNKMRRLPPSSNGNGGRDRY